MIDPRTLRFLSAADVRRALPMKEAIEVMKSAFRELSENRAVVPLRTHVPMPEHKGDVLVMPAYSPDTARFGLKVITLFENNPALHLPFIQAMVMVFDTVTGSPVAIMEGTSLTAIRSGAASGAATDLLARERGPQSGDFRRRNPGPHATGSRVRRAPDPGSQRL